MHSFMDSTGNHLFLAHPNKAQRRASWQQPPTQHKTCLVQTCQQLECWVQGRPLASWGTEPCLTCSVQCRPSSPKLVPRGDAQALAGRQVEATLGEEHLPPPLPLAGWRGRAPRNHPLTPPGHKAGCTRQALGTAFLCPSQSSLAKGLWRTQPRGPCHTFHLRPSRVRRRACPSDKNLLWSTLKKEGGGQATRWCPPPPPNPGFSGKGWAELCLHHRLSFSAMPLSTLNYFPSN